METRLIYLLIMTLVLLSCESEITPEKIKFAEQKNLSAHKLELKENAIKKPMTLLHHDSVLLVTDNYDDHLMSIIDIRTGKLLKRILKKGNGTDEFSGLFMLSKVNEEQFQFNDVNTRQHCIYNFEDILDSGKMTSHEKIITTDLPKQEDEFVFAVNMVNDELGVGLGMFNENMLALYTQNQDSTSVEYKFNFPLDIRAEHKDETNKQKFFVFQSRIKNRPNGTKAVLVHNGYNFDILDIKDKSVSKSFSMNAYLPMYHLRQQGGATFSREGKRYLLNFDVTDNEIYLCSCGGKTYEDYGSDSGYSTEIHVYDWQGNPKIKYTLDRGIFGITIDEKNKRIYSTSKNPDTFLQEIIYFDID